MTAEGKAVHELVGHFRHLVECGLPITTVLRLIAQTSAGMAVTAGLPPRDEEKFIAWMVDLMRDAFDNRQALEILMEQDAAEARR